MGCASSSVAASPSRDPSASRNSPTSDSTAFKILLLGAGEQGKSTLYKQLSSLYGVPDYPASHHRAIVRRNVCECIQTMSSKAIILAHFAVEELKSILSEHSILVKREDMDTISASMIASVEIYTESFYQSLELNGFSRHSFGWKKPPACEVRGLDMKMSQQFVPTGMDPRSEEYLAWLMSEAELVMYDLQALLTGTRDSWPAVQKSEATWYILDNPQDWCDRAVNPGLKSIDRIHNKARFKYHGDFSYIKDICRLSLEFSSFDRLFNALEHLKAKLGSKLIFLENRFLAPTALGWRDLTLHVHIQVEGHPLHICEVQLYHRTMGEARLSAHTHYRATREILEKYVEVQETERIFDPPLLQKLRAMPDPYNIDIFDSKDDYSEIVSLVIKFAKDPLVQSRTLQLAMSEHDLAWYANFDYYSKKIEEIASANYAPKGLDVFYERTKLTGIISESMMVGPQAVTVFNTGGQRSERRKWVHVMEGVGHVIIPVSLIDYDQVLYEDVNVNRMQENIDLFGNLMGNQTLLNVPFTVVFTKGDLLQTKLQFVAVKSKPEFKDFPPGTPETVDSVKKYFRSKLEALIPPTRPAPVNFSAMVTIDTNSVQAMMQPIFQSIEPMQTAGADL